MDLDQLNKHFTTVNLLSLCIKSSTFLSLSSLPVPSFTPFSFHSVTVTEIKRHLVSIKSDAIGAGGESRKMILMKLTAVLPVLCHIFNNSLSTNSFPSFWRFAFVMPIPKLTNPKSFTHYRPISILPFLSKVLERIVHQQLFLYLTKNNILSVFQSGYWLLRVTFFLWKTT